jgi:hypothetical protein
MGVGCKGAMDSNADHGVEYSLLCAYTKRTARLLTTDGHGSTPNCDSSNRWQFSPERCAVSESVVAASYRGAVSEAMHCRDRMPWICFWRSGVFGFFPLAASAAFNADQNQHQRECMNLAMIAATVAVKLMNSQPTM